MGYGGVVTHGIDTVRADLLLCFAYMGTVTLFACAPEDRGLGGTLSTGGSITTGEASASGGNGGSSTGSGETENDADASGADPGPDGDAGDGTGGQGDTGGGGGGGIRLDVGNDDSDGGGPGPGGGECVECSLSLTSEASGALRIIDDTNIFGTAELRGQIVYTIGTHGEGRFIATSDTALPFEEVTDCPLHRWLAGTDDRQSLIFGFSREDKLYGWANESNLIWSVHLPPQYVGDPAALRADFDIVMYMEGSRLFDSDAGDEPTDAEMQTLLDFVAIEGGGLYVTSEFDPYNNQVDLDSVNRLMRPLGVEAVLADIDWGGAMGTAQFEYFPPPVG